MTSDTPTTPENASAPANEGDFVGGDKTTVGDISHSTGVAIGTGATANVTIIEAPKPRIPLERPPRAEHFQDRKDELAQLLADLQPGKVVTVCGPGGMGKTALAAEAVWALAGDNQPPARFPDGILFHTFYGQSQVALALEHIARSFGEELRPTPKEAAQRALSGRRVLLLLDGTEEADDLRPLLEIRNQCGVLITSRSRKDVVAARQDLAPLPPADAVTLLQAWGGPRADNHAAVQQISQLVGRLPLALRLVGRYLAQNEESAGEYLAWLAETPLTALDQGQRQFESIPLLLARSLAQVSERARMVLGVVGLLALTPFDGAAIAAAVALSARETRQALGELINYGLLIRRAEAYEVSHALIHTYARLQLAPSSETIVKLAAYYEQAIKAHASDFARLHPLRPHIMALLSSASQREIWSAVSSLAWSIDNYLDLQGYGTDRIITITLNITAAQTIGNRRNKGALLGKLGLAYADLGQMEQAIGSYQQALTIAQESGDRRNEGNWLGNLGNAYADLGQMEQAIAYHRQALTISKEISDRRSEGIDLGNLGLMYADLGMMDYAIAYHQQALIIAQESSDRRNEGTWLGNLGNAYADLGQMEQAIAYHQQSLAIAKEIGDRRGEGADLGNLGNAYADLGQAEQARQYWEEALRIFEEIKSPNATTVRQWLESLAT